MLCLLALAWLVLVNLMSQIFSQVPITSQDKQSLLTRVKNIFYRGFYYMLSLVFAAISMALILLTYKMLKL